QDATKGLLPPNDAQGHGLGTVSYTILPKAEVTTGATITAQARVLFNTMAPQDTQVLTQTIDASAPVSTLTATQIQAGGPDYAVKWNASDEPGGSGVKHVTVYVSEDGGSYKIWLRQTQETSGIYQ